MRYSILLILLFLNVSFVSREEEKKFNQDVATIHSQKLGLPEGEIVSISIQKDDVVASTDKSSYKWNGETWKSTKNPKVKALDIPTSPQGSTMLSSTSYKNGFAIGCDNGLFIFDKEYKDWTVIFPKDKKYSWAPREVSALGKSVV